VSLALFGLMVLALLVAHLLFLVFVIIVICGMGPPDLEQDI